MRRFNRTIDGILLLLFVLFSSQFVVALGLGTFEKELRYTPDQSSSIKYIVVQKENESAILSFDFVGDLEPYVTFRDASNSRINYYWYSTKTDSLDINLRKDFDLSNVSSATLQFYTKYAIESGYDFGYIEVSTNNGTSWDQIAGTGTNLNRAVDAYVGFDGKPAYNGAVYDWTLETVNLTPYVGNITSVRFRYITDLYYTDYGWLIDDISLPEMGFFDDVDSGIHNWSANGWFRENALEIANTSRILPFYIDFIIPSTYQYNNTEEKVIVSKSRGLNENLKNQYQIAFSSIIVKLPPLVEVIPPPTPSGGGGGGAPSQHYSYSDGVLSYFAQTLQPGVVNTINADKIDTPVRNIEVVLNSAVRNAVISISPLEALPQTIKQDLPKVYRYFEVDAKNIGNLLIKRATIRFVVSKEWVESQNKRPEDVVITRFADGKWSDLETIFVGIEGENYIYDAVSPGFSVFAVRLRSPIAPKPIVKPVPTKKAKISDLNPMTAVKSNESNTKLVEERKEQLQNKLNMTKEDVELIFGPEPESPSKIAWKLILEMSAAGFVFIVIVLFVFIRRFRRRPKAADMEKVEEVKKLK